MMVTFVTTSHIYIKGKKLSYHTLLFSPPAAPGWGNLILLQRVVSGSASAAEVHVQAILLRCIMHCHIPEMSQQNCLTNAVVVSDWQHNLCSAYATMQNNQNIWWWSQTWPGNVTRFPRCCPHSSKWCWWECRKLADQMRGLRWQLPWCFEKVPGVVLLGAGSWKGMESEGAHIQYILLQRRARLFVTADSVFCLCPSLVCQMLGSWFF